MKVSFLNVPSWGHQGEYRCNGTIWQGQIGVFSDSTGNSLNNGADATFHIYEDRNYLKGIDSTGILKADSTGTIQFFIMYKYPNTDEYEESSLAYGQKILHNTPIVAVPLVEGWRVQDYNTTDNTSGIDSGVNWTAVAPGTPMYINGNGRWTTVYVQFYTSLARAIFENYKNGYVTYRIINPGQYLRKVV